MKETIEICKWKYGKESAVMFMIDDFTNKRMIDANGNDNFIGADWGGRCWSENSLMDILYKKILSKYPYLKVTLFLVVGSRSPIVEGKEDTYIAHAADEDADFTDFLRELSRSEKFEIAYHGLNHGHCVGGQFKQEYTTFDSVEDAVNSMQLGKDIFEKISRGRFFGGKYCGYEYNEFSDLSISKAGFSWWCRHWDGDLLYGIDDPVKSLELEEFEGVVDIPSTVDGSLLSLKKINRILSYNYWRSVYYFFKYKVTIEKLLAALMKNSQLINIQEHSSPFREDGIRQKPNIVDDIESLDYIFSFLQRYDLWYATGKEIEDYYRLRKELYIVKDSEGFSVESKNKSHIGSKAWVCIDQIKGKMLCCQDVEIPPEGDKGNIFEIIIGNRYVIKK